MPADNKKKASANQAKAKKEASKRIAKYESLLKKTDKQRLEKLPNALSEGANGTQPGNSNSQRSKKDSPNKKTFIGLRSGKPSNSQSKGPGITYGQSTMNTTGNKLQNRGFHTVQGLNRLLSSTGGDLVPGGKTMSGNFGTMTSSNFSGIYPSAPDRIQAYEDCQVYNGINSASNLSAFSPPTKSYAPVQPSDSDDEDFLNALNEPSEIDEFLADIGLQEYSGVFKHQKVDMDLLMTLTEDDLMTTGLQIPLGPRKKILTAVKRRQAEYDPQTSF